MDFAEKTEREKEGERDEARERDCLRQRAPPIKRQARAVSKNFFYSASQKQEEKERESERGERERGKVREREREFLGPTKGLLYSKYKNSFVKIALRA